MTRGFFAWVAQAASLSFAAACREHSTARSILF
jgi:hypothetical protein